jgi:hypothetical protein
MRVSAANPLFFTTVFLFSLIGSVTAQAPLPTSTPTPNTPEVVSRDDVRESLPTTAKTNRTARPVPKPVSEPDIELPRTNASPYNINLSEAQKKLILYLDILTKTESRAETLRSRLFEMIEKENKIRSYLRQLDFGLRDEQIQNSAALSGSLRPEKVREQRARSLNADKRSQEQLLRQIVSSRRNLETSLLGADRLVDMVRRKFELFVEQALQAEIDSGL